MNRLNKQLNSLPKPKMSLVKKISLKYRLYVLIIQDSFSFEFLLSRKFQYRAISLVLLLSLLFGLPMYSYASPGVNEKHFLYPVKLAIENIEFKTANTEIEKQEKYEKFSERRLNEAEVLSEKLDSDEDRMVISNTIKEALELKDKAREISFSANQEEKEENRISQRKSLNNIASFVGIEEDDDLVEDIAAAMDNIGEQGHGNNNKKGEIIRDASSTKSNLDQNRSNSSEQARSASPGQEKKEEEQDRNQDTNIERFAELKESVESLKVDLGDEDYDEKDLEILFERLDKRIETVNEAIENEDQKNVNGIINSTKSITNNAKHFIKSKDSDRSNSSKGSSGKGKGK